MELDTDFQTAIKDRFLQLPKVVQDAITSADVEQHLRALAQEHNLHVDQWGKLEDQVQMTLLGIHEPGDLAKNIEKDIGVDSAAATALAADIFKIVFEPIREELERELDHPAATIVQASEMDTMRSQALANDADHTTGTPPALATIATDTVIPTPPATPPIAPATPPNTPPAQKVERTQIAPAYAPNVASHERKTIEGDPYREQIV